MRRGLKSGSEAKEVPARLLSVKGVGPAQDDAEQSVDLVVVYGNIPLVGFFDLLYVVVARHHCKVKPTA